MQTQKEQWLTFVELGRKFNLQPARVSLLVARHNLEIRDSNDRRKKLVRLSDFEKAIGK